MTKTNKISQLTVYVGSIYTKTKQMLFIRAVLAVILSTAIQVIWTARNDKVFNDTLLGSRQLINKFKYHIHFRIKCDINRLTNDQFREIWANRPICANTDWSITKFIGIIILYVSASAKFDEFNSVININWAIRDARKRLKRPIFGQKLASLNLSEQL